MKTDPHQDLCWHRQPLRIAALQCAQPGDPKNVLARWAELGFNAEQLLHVVGDGYYGFFDPQRHGQALGEYLQAAHAANVRIIVYLNVHKLPPETLQQHPDWCQLDSAGQMPRVYSIYPLCCVNSPWRDHALSALHHLCNYAIDGIFLDGPMMHADGCYCAACRRLFAAATPHTIPQPNQPWPSSQARQAFQQFRTDSLVRFVADAGRVLKQRRPEAIYYMNNTGLGPVRTGADTHALLPHLDWVGTEGGFQFYGPPRQSRPWRPGAAAKWLEALAPNKTRIIFIAGDHKPWSRYLHTAAETTFALVQTVAHGANPWYGLHSPLELLDGQVAEAVGQFNTFHARNPQAFTQTRSAAAVGLLYCQATADQAASAERTDFTAARESRARGSDYINSFHGWYEILLRSGLPFDLIDAASLPAGLDGQRIRALITADASALPDQAAAALLDHSRQGGLLIGQFGITEKLYDCFGVQPAGQPIDMADFNYMRLVGPAGPLRADTLLPAPRWAQPIDPTEPATVLARFHAAAPSRYADLGPPTGPAVVENTCGRGRTLYVAGTFGEAYHTYGFDAYRLLIQSWICRHADLPARLAEPTGLAELVHRLSPDGHHYLHLINHAAAIHQRPIERFAPLHDVWIDLAAAIRVRSARALLPPGNVDVVSTQGGCRLRLDCLEAYQIIQLEI